MHLLKTAQKNTFRFKQRFYSITNLLKNQVLFYERVEKVDTLPYGNAARSKIKDFRTALPTLAVPKENNRLEREFSLTAAP